jgi:hypothetical protein
MAKRADWERDPRDVFREKVRRTPARVLRNRVLRERFLVNFFHDAIFRTIKFDQYAQTLAVELASDRVIVPKYSRKWGIRLPEYIEGPHYFLWRCEFDHVTHFSLNALLTKAELRNGNETERNYAISSGARLLDYVGGQFLSSRILDQHQRKFKRRLFHLEIDCELKKIDVIFEGVRVRRLEKTPHYWHERTKFRRYLRRA